MEAEMIRRGEERGRTIMARDYKRGKLEETPAGVALAKRALKPYVDGLEKWRKEAMTGNATRTATAALLLQHLKLETVAYIACRTIVSNAAKQTSLWSTARQVCNMLEVEIIPSILEKKNIGLYTTTLKNARRRSKSPLRQSHALRRAGADMEGLPYQVWSNEEKLQLGTALVDLFIEYVGVVDIERYQDGPTRTRITMRFTSKIEEWFDKYNEMAYLAKPFFLPMTEVPQDWDDVSGGGFRHTTLPIITKATKERLDILRKADLSNVYAGLNALQRTPWAINERVLEVMETLWKADAEYSFIPRQSDIPLPEKPLAVENDEVGGEHRKKWRRTVRAIYEENARTKSIRFEFARSMRMARQYTECDQFYFVYRLDFRGRTYASSTSLNPQSSDNVRGLLRFAEGMPLDDRARWWLGIQGANLFGEDKISLEERYRWAMDFHPTAVEIARDPIGNIHSWSDADDPWQFLAWCFEWSQKDDQGFLSHLPVHLDGSCNGIQHFSAMLRDEVGGQAVNLIPSSVPADIYQEVANAVVARLGDMTLEDDPENYWRAQAWLAFGIDRKITKRAVMVLPYGGTMFSCVEYVRTAVRDKISEGHPCPFGELDLPKEAAWLGMVVWESISTVVIKAREVMAWLQSVADICSDHNVPLTWHTPSGFVVHQLYKQVKHRRVRTKFQGSLIRFRSYEEIDPIDRQKQRTAFSPNYVHSLDAAVLMLTIQTSKINGVDSFAMIHDSYGTHAYHTDALAAATRASFVVFYEEPVLENLRDEILASLPDGVELPPLPSRGSLQIQDVLNSDYFFA